MGEKLQDILGVQKMLPLHNPLFKGPNPAWTFIFKNMVVFYLCFFTFYIFFGDIGFELFLIA